MLYIVIFVYYFSSPCAMTQSTNLLHWQQKADYKSKKMKKKYKLCSQGECICPCPSAFFMVRKQIFISDQ